MKEAIMTTLYRNTKISTILKANKDSVEVMAAIAKPFEKLRNPLLRKLLAGRTTLAAAAKMGHCDLIELTEALKPLGFVFINEDGQKDEKEVPDLIPGFAASLDEYPKTVLDVRSYLAAGQDPLKKIMTAVNELPPGHLLQLINSFEPTPLITLLAKKGFASYVRMESPEEVHTFFKPTGDKGGSVVEQPVEMTDGKAFTTMLNSFGEKKVELDVTMMEMPLPMLTILESLSTLPEKHVLSVKHRRIPLFLFRELKERGFRHLICKPNDTDITLLIFR